MHVAWSNNGRDFTGEKLIYQFIDIVISVEEERDIPPDPKVNLPPRGERTQLGTRSKDLDVLDHEREAKKDDLKITSADLREAMEMDGQTDRYEKIQPDRPELNEELIRVIIEQMWEFNELYGNNLNQWCKGKVVSIKKRNKVHIQWEDYTLHESYPKIPQEILAKSRYNKHVAGKKGVLPGCRMNLDEQISVKFSRTYMTLMHYLLVFAYH